MKRICKFSLFLMALLFMSITNVFATEGVIDEITFGNSTICNSIFTRSAIASRSESINECDSNKKMKNIYQEDINTIMQLPFGTSEITESVIDFKGLEYFVKVETLDAAGSNATEFKNFPSLTNLTMLNVQGNSELIRITDITDMELLETLTINSNGKLETMDVLGKIPELKTISAMSNSFRDLNWVKDAPKLETLSITQNDQLNEYVNKMNIDGIKNAKLPKLETIDLNSGIVTNIDSLISVKNSLKHLNIENNKVKNVSILTKLTKLETLNINYNPISYFGNLLLLNQQTKTTLNANNEIYILLAKNETSITSNNYYIPIDYDNPNFNSIELPNIVKKYIEFEKHLDPEIDLDNIGWTGICNYNVETGKLDFIKENVVSILESIKLANPTYTKEELYDAFEEENICGIRLPHFGVQLFLNNYKDFDDELLYVNSFVDGDNSIITENNILKDRIVSFDEIDISSIKDNINNEMKNIFTNKGLISLFDITLSDDPALTYVTPTGDIKIRIKLTDEMKKYKDLSVVYLLDNNSVTDEVYETKIVKEGNVEYLEFTTGHLSKYAIVGTVSSTTVPNTSDSITTIIPILVISLLSLVVITKQKKHINI